MTGDGDGRLLISSIELPAEMSSWDDLMGFIKSQVDKSLDGSDKAYGVLLSSEELLSNIIRVASSNPERQSGPTVVRVHSWQVCNGGKTSFELEISDNGAAFDPHFYDIPNQIPDTPVEQRSIGGLGLYLVKSSVDRVSYSYSGGYNIYNLYTCLS